MHHNSSYIFRYSFTKVELLRETADLMDPFVDHNHEPDLGYAQDVVARDICRKYVKTNLQNSVLKEVWEIVKDGIARIWSPDEVKDYTSSMLVSSYV